MTLAPPAGDATALIKAALSQGAADNVPVVLEPGVFEISGTITISAALGTVPPALLGSGEDLTRGTVIRATAPGNAAVKIENPQGCRRGFALGNLAIDAGNLKLYGLLVHGAQRIRVHDVAVTHAGDAGVWLRGEEGYGIYYSAFERLSVQWSGGSGILMSSPEDEPLGPIRVAAISLRDCFVARNRSYGIQVRYASPAIYGGSVETNGAAGLLVTRSWPGGVSVYGAYFEKNGTRTIDPVAETWAPSTGVDTAVYAKPEAVGVEVFGGRVIGQILGDGSVVP